MGNQMFRYALARTIAEMKGFNFYQNPKKWRGHGVLDIDFGKRDGVIKHTFHDTNQQEFNPKVFDMQDFTLLYGFFQSEKYFDHEKTRKWFKVIAEAPDIYDYNEYCFIHFRGGDYNIFPWSIYQLPNSYYELAMAKMLEINTNLKFVFVTDDKQEVARRFPEIPIVSSTTAKDFALLNKAKYVIISNSTYAWWAAWLNLDNTVVGPSGWTNYNMNKGVFSPADIKIERFNWV